MRCASLLMAALLAACAPIERHRNQPKNSEMPETPKEHVPDNNFGGANLDNESIIKRLCINDEDWVEFNIKNGRAKIVNHASSFKRKAALDLHIDGRGSGREAFLSFCESIDFRKPSEINGILGSVNFIVNPLSSYFTRRLISTQIRPDIITVENTFIINDIKLKVFAKFLSPEEINWIETRTDLLAISEIDEIIASIFGLAFGLEKIKKDAFTRLLCGLANQEAVLHYQLMDESGKTIFVDITDATFDKQQY